jgi:ubiquinone/menaquinone biosynthesis C-methylase UbiE
LVALAKQNLAGCSNVQVKQGHGALIPAADNTFSRVLLLEVIQLIPPEEIPAVFRELQRVSRHSARILIGSIPNVRHREAFLEPYLAGLRQATHLDAAKKAAIIARNQRAYWYDTDELTKWWRALGGQVLVQPLSPQHPNANHRFHLIVSVEKS